MSAIPSDLDIATAARSLPIRDVAGRLGIEPTELIPYGHDKAKISYRFLDSIRDSGMAAQFTEIMGLDLRRLAL